MSETLIFQGWTNLFYQNKGHHCMGLAPGLSPPTTHFYRVKLGLIGIYIISLYFCSKPYNKLQLLVTCFEQKKEKKRTQIFRLNHLLQPQINMAV